MKSILLNSKKAKVVAITRWLLSNARYQSTPLRKEEAESTAAYYVEKLNVHSVKWTKYYHDEEDEESIFMEFCVEIGVPKFRGSASYKLPVHSLRFTTDRPSSVYITHNEEMPKWIEDMSWGTLGYNSIPFTQVDEHKQYSLHPHISENGEPCLGGWANAWSSCVATGNILSLIPVAQSFLNTWTRNDAYWDINWVYTKYRNLPQCYKKVYSMNDFFVVYKWLGAVTQRANLRSRRSTAFFTWCNRNEELLENLLYHKEMCPKKIHASFVLAESCSRIVGDTENRLVKRIRQGSFVLDDILERSYQKFNQVLDGPPQNAYTIPLIAESVLEEKRFYFTSVLKPQAPATWVVEVRRLRDYIASKIDRIIGDAQRNGQGIDIGLSSIFEFIQHSNRKKQFKDRVYLDYKKVLESLHYYTSNYRDSESFELYDAINKTLKLIDGNATISQDIYDDPWALAGQLVECFLEMDELKNINDNWDEMVDCVSDHIVHQALDNIERLAVNLVTKKVNDGKSKHKRLKSKLAVERLRDDAQQSQLSLEAF